MRTEPVLNDDQYAIYHKHLQSDHDFRIRADVLNLDETALVASLDVLDGQINFSTDSDEGPERTASLVTSDPEGVLDYGKAFAYDSTGRLLVARLIRVQHMTIVPTIGEVTATGIVGSPTAVSQSGAEVSLELADKSILSDHGVRPANFKKGLNVQTALIQIIRDHGGEGHYRIPATPKKGLSRSYSIGMGGDALTPWQLFRRIASAEMGWRAFYSCDGYATCEPTKTATPIVQVDHMLAVPSASTSFTDFTNYVKVTSNRKMVNKRGTKKKSDDLNYTIRYEGVVGLPVSDALSENSLARNGVVRTMPMVVVDNNLKNQAQVNARADALLKSSSSISTEQSYEIIPFFHLDKGDQLRLPGGVEVIPFDKASVPLGVGGNMTLGSVKWVSKTVKVRRLRSKATVIKPKKKGGNKNR